jgi:pSer/pThr/pTyr-binding forkhead associated (FHA) protein
VKLNVSKNQKQLFHRELKHSGENVAYFIGRNRDSVVLLDDYRVSRSHAKIFYENDAWYIEKVTTFDNFSINGQNVNKKQLELHDLIVINPFVLEVEDIVASSVQAPAMDNAVKIEDSGKSSNTGDGNSDDIGVFTSFQSVNELLPENSVNATADDSGSGDYINKSENDTGGNDAPENLFTADGPNNNNNNDLMSLGENTQMFEGFVTIRLDLFGENIPYDHYIVSAAETVIGRDINTCQIILNDPEVSSVHAKVIKMGSSLVLRDCKSTNGVILNGRRVNERELKDGDEFVIGSTSFSVNIYSDLLQLEKDRLMPVLDKQVKEVEEFVEIADFADEAAKPVDGGIKSLFSKGALQDPQKRKKILIYAVVILGLWIVLTEDPKPKTPAAPKVIVGQRDMATTEADAEKKTFTEEQLQYLNANYLLAKEHLELGNYQDAIIALDNVIQLDPNFNEVNQLYAVARQGLREFEEIERRRREEEAEKERQLKIANLLEKAREAVKERNEVWANSLFAEISTLDPENYEVNHLKREIELWKAEQERLAIEKAAKEAERNRQIGLLKPGKGFFQRKEWYKAIIKLEEFTGLNGIDEDLLKEANEMLTISRDSLNALINPLLEEARRLVEGQDLKGAYQKYISVFEIYPIHVEALEQMEQIRETLTLYSRKLYREAIIEESLSLFKEAKEKLQDVLQISTTDSDYYKKATAKLKDYRE